MEGITRAWKGEEKLWIVFWLYNFLLGGLLSAALDRAAGGSPIVLAAVAIFTMVWAVWVTVALWRGAFNTRWRGWGYMVRGVLVLAVGLLIVSVLIPTWS